MAVILSSVNSSYCMFLQGLCFVEDRGIGISPGMIHFLIALTFCTEVQSY